MSRQEMVECSGKFDEISSFALADHEGSDCFIDMFPLFLEVGLLIDGLN